jgi:hypothetical protein
MLFSIIALRKFQGYWKLSMFDNKDKLYIFLTTSQYHTVKGLVSGIQYIKNSIVETLRKMGNRRWQCGSVIM